MKHTYKSGSLLMLAMVVVGMLYQFADHPWKAAKKLEKSSNQTAKPDIPQKTISELQQGLEKREYHISFDAEKQSLQSPNRKQNLRAYYKPGKVLIQNRVDSAGQNFKLQLTTAGIYADGQKLYAPDQNAEVSNHENQLDIHSRGLTEQYINSEAGVRQNFIIDNAPDGARSLEVRLAADGLRVSDKQNNELHFYSEKEDGKKTTRLIYNDLKCWDSHGKVLDATLAYQNERIVIAVDVANAVFPVTIDPIISNGNPGNASATLESNQAGASFGYSLSSAGDVNGDGYSDVLVGARLYDQGQQDEGAVFLYHGSAEGLNNLPATVLESNQAGAQMGWSVSTAGDINKDGYSDIIVGAPLFDNGQVDEGAIFTYNGGAAGLSNTASKFLDGNQTNGQMGYSVALAGDVNADGFSDVIIGAYLYDKGQTDEGVAAVYHGSAQGLAGAATSVLENNQVAAQFGFSVRGAGDVNGDGYSDVIVGSPLYDNGQQNEGAAYIYYGSALGTNVNNPTVIEKDLGGAVVGWSVSAAGDVNGDGYGDILIGAPLHKVSLSNEGAVFIHHGSANGVVQQTALMISGKQNGAKLGISVAGAGDVNGDGFGDIIIGASAFDKGETDEGAAYIHHGSENGILANAASTLESNQTNAQMGCSVASAGDVNGDGYSDVVVGAYLYDKGQVDEGGAFVWMGGASGNDVGASVAFELNQSGALLGWSVASAGDVNSDGYGDIIIGANLYDNGQVDEGVAFIYHGSSSGINLVPAAILEINQTNASMGSSVSTAGDVNGDGFSDVIVGAYLFDNAKVNAGAAFLYYGSQQGIIKDAKFKMEGDQEDGNLGNAVSGAEDINGDGYSDIIIGESGYDIYQQYIDEGRAIVLYGSSTGPNVMSKVLLNGSMDGINMGSSVSKAGDINGDGFGDIIVGNPFQGTNDKPYTGAAFVYYGSAQGINPLVFVKLAADKEESRLGQSVSAGDFNGDGFSDVIAGAPNYTNGQFEEGAFYIYMGSAGGISTVPTLVESNRDHAYFGSKVSNAGDLNGDGYSDFVVAASGYTNGQVNEGAFFIYHGSNNSIANTAALTIEGNQESAFMGNAIASAGDVNGDGYGDLVVSAHQYDKGEYNEGVVWLYYGNAGKYLKNNLRLYNSDLNTPINHNQFPQNNFGAGLYTKSFLGGNKGKLVWETKPKGQGFSKGADNVITHSTQSSGAQNVYASLGLTGVELKNVITKQGAATKFRARVKYDPVLALTGQTYGPWRYLPSYLSGGGVAPVPDKAFSEMSETVNKKNPDNLNVIVYPNPVVEKLFVQVGDAAAVANIQLYSTAGRLLKTGKVGERELNVKDLETGTYILLINQGDGTQISRKVLIRK